VSCLGAFLGLFVWLVRGEEWEGAAAEFEALRSMPGLSDGFLAHLDEVEAEGARGRR